MLRQELDENRRMLEDSNKKLKELDEVKSRFFANISHELRTPLTLLLAPLESLLRQYNRPADADSRNLLTTMQANGMRLLKLINELLDLVRLESGVRVVKRDSVEMTGVRERFVAVRRGRWRTINGSSWRHLWHSEIRVGADGSRQAGKIVAEPGVQRAPTFTPAGGTVELRAEKQGSEMTIVVRDTGMGISAKTLPHVFDRFWQADDSARRKYQGVGIGLALVKELVEVQGGKVAVASVEGKGTTFTCHPALRESGCGCRKKLGRGSSGGAGSGSAGRRNGDFAGMVEQSLSSCGIGPGHDAGAGGGATGRDGPQWTSPALAARRRR